MLAARLISNGHQISAIEAKSSSSEPLSPQPPSARSSGLAPPNSTNARSRMAISPRSANYERLEGGMGPSRLPAVKRFAWKKFAIGAALIIGIVWFFGPRESRTFTWGSKNNGGYYPGTVVDTAPLPGPPAASRPTGTTKKPIIDTTKPPTNDKNTLLTFETDPDPSKTTECTKPYKPDARLVQYALMIDAGSTGSRIHIYKFNNCGPSAKYEYEVFNITKPGLSGYKGHPLDAARSLDVLMDQAVRVVPEELQSCTPVAVKATAGLRLLPGTQSADIIAAVERRLHEEYPFPLAEKDPVVIMDGKDEGVYAWITANYLLDTIRSDSKDTATYAVLDLGGASTQIAFEPTFSRPDSSLVEGEHKYDLVFGGKKHLLYQHSYLGYGLMSARQHVHQLVDFMASIRMQGDPKDGAVVGNPCIAKGVQRMIEIEDERSNIKRNVTMDGEEIGSFEACNRVIELVMAKDAICEVKPCSFNGVYQPSLLDTFHTGKVLLLSYFYDRLAPLLPPSTPITVSTVAATARDVCQGRPQWLKRWGANAHAMAELGKRAEYCLDLTFMYGLLRLGYEFEDTREMVIGKQLQNTELGWCLGATLAMVGGELTCRI
ncbi:putative guanosine-diphosphatase [Hypsizygus marmoreus]|uniref:guanosine-diphosphatase n=1 Tax=Hypsizygus marmoreus TaxID=39966 RepID=A0A369J086_HYPMA|nr:putative guanosine-diphosphatase [Hypsizygus marmoreus]